MTKLEIENAIKLLKIDKSPGEDGIIAEFYKEFWYLIKIELTEIILESFADQTLSDSQYFGMISLLYKNGEREDIKNWRPITLLNADYKICSKILAERLKPVLPKIIGTDQNGFVQGRHIFNSNRLIEDIFDYTDAENEEGAIIFLDQMKAFDRIEWEWLDECLKDFNFGDNFREWVMMLFKHAKTSILTNGFQSKYVNISRSIRQGCPIAPMLYILQAEPLASSIRQNSEIKGIKLPEIFNEKKEVKLNMFADDTQLFNKTEESIEKTFEILEIYEKASGSKINLNKTVGVYLGRWKNKQPKFKKIKWTKEPIKALGVIHGHKIDLNEIWLKKIQKIKSCLEIWKSRDLTYKGRVLILKSLIISQIGFEIEMRGIPDNFKKEINQLMWSFIWEGKNDQIKRDVCVLSHEEGGIGMINIDSFINAKHIKSMHKILNSEVDNWNTIGKWWLQKLDHKFDIPYFISTCSDLNGQKIDNMPIFYQNIIKSWSKFISKQCPRTDTDVYEQFLFGNSQIRDRGKPLLFPSFAKSGLTQIKHIWDVDTHTFKTDNFIFNKLSDKRNWIVQWLIIKSSIPKRFLNIMRDSIADDANTKESNSIIVKDVYKFFNSKNKIMANKDVSLKLLQKELNIKTKPNCELKWNIYFNKELPWKQIWSKIYYNFASRKSNQLSWKIIHNIVYTEEKLQKIGRSRNGLCHFCKIQLETLVHLFYGCNVIQELWRRIYNMIQNNARFEGLINLELNEESILLGLNDLNPVEKKLYQL